jgi:hypothetical protein
MYSYKVFSGLFNQTFWNHGACPEFFITLDYKVFFCDAHTRALCSSQRSWNCNIEVTKYYVITLSSVWDNVHKLEYLYTLKVQYIYYDAYQVYDDAYREPG